MTARGDTFTAGLARAIGFESAQDARNLVARIRALSKGGESDTQILERLNGPARPKPVAKLEDVLRSTDEAHPGMGGIAFVRTPRVPPAREIDAAPVRIVSRTCLGCSQAFSIPSSRGRYPQMGPCCRPPRKA